MKKEELFEVLSDIDQVEVEKAKDYTVTKKHRRLKWTIPAVCAAAALLGIGAFFMFKGRDKDISSGSSGSRTQSAEIVRYMASYPAPTASQMTAEQFVNGDAHYYWWERYVDTTDKTRSLSSEMSGYYSSLMKLLLVSDDENTVCSPLNTYVAFSMLAEVTDGNTRKQILDMLGVSDIDTLRRNVKALWESNYVDTPIMKSLLANSLWLSNTFDYNTDTLNRLAADYYASSFSGTPGSEDMNKALKEWVDSNTGGLLKEYTADMSLDSRTILEMVSTIYFKAKWATEFDEGSTTDETFHGTKGDKNVKMMHMSEMSSVYQGDNFTVLAVPLADSGNMYFYLPKEGVAVNNLASDPEVIKSLTDADIDKSWAHPMVNMSIPRFKISGKSDLTETIKKLGVTDVLDPETADFSPLSEKSDELFLSKADHAAMLEINENGVTGAAFVDMGICGAAMSTDVIDFVLDRPFMFAVTGYDGSLLFSGIVRNIE